MEIKIFKFIFFNEKKKKTNKHTYEQLYPPPPKKKEKNKTNPHKVLFDDLFAIPNAFPHQ